MTATTDDNIVAYGAIGDGTTINTKAIPAAVDACAAAGSFAKLDAEWRTQAKNEI